MAALGQLAVQVQHILGVPVVRRHAEGGLLLLLQLVAAAQRAPVGRDGRGGQQLAGPVPQSGDEKIRRRQLPGAAVQLPGQRVKYPGLRPPRPPRQMAVELPALDRKSVV